MKFRFDELRMKAERLARKCNGSVTINLPFVSFAVSPDDTEKRVAREILIRLPDKRVLSSKECCDDCITKSLASIQEIRAVLVDKQVDLSHFNDGALYLLIEYMAEAVRQFLTFSERLQSIGEFEREVDFRRPYVQREMYFEALEKLRFHIHSCLKQVAVIADMSSPKVDAFLHSNEEWYMPAYEQPEALGCTQGYL